MALYSRAKTDAENRRMAEVYDVMVAEEIFSMQSSLQF